MKKRRKGKMSVKKVGDTTVVKYTMKLNKKQKDALAQDPLTPWVWYA